MSARGSRDRQHAAEPPILAVRGLAKSYDGRRVLAGVDFDLCAGECLAILGRSGSGKSVTLRLLLGLDPADFGSVRFEGAEIAGLDERALVPIRRRMAMLFQSGALFDSMSVGDNLAFPLREHTTLDERAVAARVAELLASVHLSGIEAKMPADLSGGMKKRVALARALALAPEVVLFDEPTTGLDPMTSASIASLIRTIHDGRRASIVVTHDLALARRVADRIAFLDDGRFRFVGSFADAERAADPLLAAFLAGREEETAHVA